MYENVLWGLKETCNKKKLTVKKEMIPLTNEEQKYILGKKILYMQNKI